MDTVAQKLKTLDLETLIDIVHLQASKDWGHIEEEVSTPSGIRGPNDEFEIAVCGYRPCGDGKYLKSVWHTIKVQDPDPERPSSSGNVTIKKKLLYPLVRMMYKTKQHVALGFHLYSLGGLYPVGSEGDSDSDGDIAHPFESKRYRRVWRLDVNRPSAGWKAVPPMTFPNRYDPPSVALQGKLYVLGGFFKSQFPEEAAVKELGWMEAYDPISNTWEPLPNPPSGFFLDADPLIFAALESKNQILVARYNHDDRKLICDSATFCIYDVITRTWTKLEPDPRMLFARYPDRTERRSIAVGNTLYWGLLEGEDIIVQAYELDMDRWIHGRFNIRPFVGEDEFPADNIFPASPPLLHLNNQRFCLFFLTSCYDRNTCQVSNLYLNCLILDISPINDEGKPHEQHDYYDHKCYGVIDEKDNYHNHVHDHFWRLNISFVTIQKYPLVTPIQLCDAVLLKQTWFPETGFSKKEGGGEKNVTEIVINDEAHDFRSLLSSFERDFLVRNNGDQVKIESLKGKKLALYFSASWGGFYPRFTPILIEVYNELSSKCDFEVIFVWGDKDEESFEGYFSKMPWLAIPFSDSETRDRLGELFRVRDIPLCVILDEDGKVVSDNGVAIIWKYGIEAYPFTQQKIKDLKDQEEAARKNQSLRSILVSHSRDFVISSDGKKVPVSELEGKTVGLCFSPFLDRDPFIQKLYEVYKKLKAKGENFEIVWIPLEDEESFNRGFKSLPWFALPVKDKSCEKLVWYFELTTLPTLVIIGPDGKTLQSNVAEAIHEHGVLAYPFTPERFTELAEVKAKQEAQTLESILVSGDKDFVIGKDGVKIPATDLVGKNILLHFAAQWCPKCIDFLPKLMDAYHKIKAKDDAFEVIFISSDKDQASFDEFFSGMPWLALPFGDPRKASLDRTFKARGGIPQLVAIGPSGKTVTKEARDIHRIHGADAYPLIDELLKEI